VDAVFRKSIRSFRAAEVDLSAVDFKHARPTPLAPLNPRSVATKPGTHKVEVDGNAYGVAAILPRLFLGRCAPFGGQHLFLSAER
jgi:hypothetical protein